MERAFRKLRATVLTSTTVKAVKVNAEGLCEVEIEGKKGAETLTADVVLSAVGIQSNIEGIGLEELGIAVERDKIVVDKFYRTNVPGVYAIGDIVPGPALAHVASAEGVCCVEAICGLNPAPVDYSTIPSCVFTSPEVASVGMTEQQAQERGIAYKTGRFPFTASGKATAAGDRDGFVKLIFDQNDKLLGAHLVGANVTEMLAEPTLAKSLGATVQQIAHTIHAHPTMNEGVMEAAEVALGAAIHV
jgi:dihydrolipoamide dehydrogenase